MTLHWKAVEQYFTVVLFVFQFYPASNFGKFISFGLGNVRSERVEVFTNGDSFNLMHTTVCAIVFSIQYVQYFSVTLFLNQVEEILKLFPNGGVFMTHYFPAV